MNLPFLMIEDTSGFTSCPTCEAFINSYHKESVCVLAEMQDFGGKVQFTR